VPRRGIFLEPRIAAYRQWHRRGAKSRARLTRRPTRYRAGGRGRDPRGWSVILTRLSGPIGNGASEISPSVPRYPGAASRVTIKLVWVRMPSVLSSPAPDFVSNRSSQMVVPASLKSQVEIKVPRVGSDLPAPCIFRRGLVSTPRLRPSQDACHATPHHPADPRAA